VCIRIDRLQTELPRRLEAERAASKQRAGAQQQQTSAMLAAKWAALKGPGRPPDRPRADPALARQGEW
jgi:hypothetical protein